MTVRIRGIYATALTALFDDVVQPSAVIDERADESLPVELADVRVETTFDRQGVEVTGQHAAVETAARALTDISIDTFSWPASLPAGGVYAGEVTETLGSGALVDCGEGTGFLPYSKTATHVDTGDRLRVQVREPEPPWGRNRPVLDTSIRISQPLGGLVRGGSQTANTGPELADILPVDPPRGWGIEWDEHAGKADLSVLAAVLERLSERARNLDRAFSDADPPAEAAPSTYWSHRDTRWVWFGRTARFTLDEYRRELAPTMAGHHRIKAGSRSASGAVDFVEKVCPFVAGGLDGGVRSRDGDSADAPADSDGDQPASGNTDSFPFDAVTDQFGPTVGESISIGHGKPDGRRINLGRGEVTDITEDGQVTLRRELSGAGTYDGLGVEKHDGDVAITRFKAGRWWYPTVYTGADGTRRGTYINICTPVEVFPDEIRYVDLYVDVLKHTDGTVERVDEVELDAARKDGLVTQSQEEKALAVAAAIERSL